MENHLNFKPLEYSIKNNFFYFVFESKTQTYYFLIFSVNKMAKITEDELDDIKERYDCYDKKGDGKIDTCQIIDVLRACGLNPLKPDVDKVK